MPKVRDLARDARALHVVFRNAYRDYAVRSAQRLMGLLDNAGVHARAA